MPGFGEEEVLTIPKGSATRPIFSSTVDRCLSLPFSTGVRKFVMDGEHLELRGITKEQSGSYECMASNDISTPDTRTVQVVVNCEDLTDTQKHTSPYSTYIMLLS